MGITSFTPAPLSLAQPSFAKDQSQITVDPNVIGGSGLDPTAFGLNPATTAPSSGIFGTLTDWTKNFKIPSLSDVLTGMQNGPKGDVSSAATALGVDPASVQSYFLRGTVIILGLIFIAVGLSLFRQPNQTIVQGAKKILS